ncbi:MAG: cob(I)yrinic acid a,c-diamide adenosyltransferase, partial [Myxococcales bacterium]|nr:cob(I)yrinic acid a,c-diamide adenosyltransferase [Myxococcales bacterium]
MKALQKQQRDEVKKRVIDRGVLVVHTGDGKGKSTAGFGVAIRAAGHGQKVGVVQFVKGTWKTGEQAALRRFPEIEHVVAGEGFTWNTQDRE